jgi:hypothetical protein
MRTVDDLCDMLVATGVSDERERFLGDVRCDILTRSAMGKHSWIDVEVCVSASFTRLLEKSNERGELARKAGYSYVPIVTDSIGNMSVDPETVLDLVDG